MSAPTTNDVHVNSAMSIEIEQEDSLNELKRLIHNFIQQALELHPMIKAYPNEHAARQHAPDKYKSIRRQNDKFGSGIHVLFGVLPNDKTEVQSIRFDASKFTPEQARAWLEEHNYQQSLEEATHPQKVKKNAKITFTDEAWRSPESDLEAASYCSVCLIDANTDRPKVKSECHLPIRSNSGAPVNRNALRNAAARLNQVKNITTEQRVAAKSKLISLMQQAGIETTLDKAEPDSELLVEVIKTTDSEQRLSYGIAYPVFQTGMADSQGDWMTPTEIEKMAHRFMIESQRYDIQHQIFDLDKSDAVVVESYIAPVDFTWELPVGVKEIHKGDWIVVTHYPNDITWQAVKKGEINAYSIRGWGLRIHENHT